MKKLKRLFINKSKKKIRTTSIRKLKPLPFIKDFENELHIICEKYDYFTFYINNTLDIFLKDIEKLLTKYKIKFDNLRLLAFVPLLFKFKEYKFIKKISATTVNNDGIIVASYKEQEKTQNILIKMLRISNKKKDILLFEILTSQIFLNISIYYPDYFESINRHTIPLGYSFLSYVKDDNWNYNDLKYIYSFLNLTYHSLPLFHIYITKFINGLSLFSILTLDLSIDNIKKAFDIIFKEKFCKLYEFLINMGFYFRFFHGDLHLSNIIFCFDSQELVIIDYGRSHFNLTSQLEEINEMTKYHIKKLGYDIILENFDINTDYKYLNVISKYSKFYSNLHNLFLLDMITLTLNYYIYFYSKFDIIEIKKFVKLIHSNMFGLIYEDGVYKTTNFIFTEKKGNILKNLIDKYLSIYDIIISKTFQYILDVILLFCIIHFKYDFIYKYNFCYIVYGKDELLQGFLDLIDEALDLIDEENKQKMAERNPLFAVLFGKQITGGSNSNRNKLIKYKFPKLPLKEAINNYSMTTFMKKINI